MRNRSAPRSEIRDCHAAINLESLISNHQKSIEQFRAFVDKSAHSAVMRRRRTWFEPMASAYLVLWWVPVGHIPTVAEAKERLEMLRTQGDMAAAFSIMHSFAAPQQTWHVGGAAPLPG
jgi:Domain of unknown function (DUF3291)